MKKLIANPNFRLFWLGEAISLLGDQFLLIALPWLVLKLTGDPLATGTVLAVAGIPRAVFMLVGGAITDRFTPRLVMLLSNVGRMALVAVLAALVLSGLVELWMIYIFALLFGLADAFFFPAQSAIVPQLAGRAELQLANTLVQGTVQLSLFAGPVLAGLLIAVFSAGDDLSLRGVGLALVVDAVTFLASAFTLWFVRLDKPAMIEQAEGILKSLRDGVALVWREPVLRTIFVLIAAANFLIVGPINVGIPILADVRLPEGAAAFGVVMSAFGAGSVLGLVLVAALPKPPEHRLGTILIVVWSFVGLRLAAMGVLVGTVPVAIAALLMGVANSYVTITFITWLQLRVPEAAMGRVMSLMMFFSVGLLPISNTLSGIVADLNLTLLFVGFGLTMAVLVLVAMAPIPRVRRMEVGLVAGD
ncbi:MAG: MFS transporter [Anaerolineae bacterium]